jgi:glutamine cyclotransferase
MGRPLSYVPLILTAALAIWGACADSGVDPSRSTRPPGPCESLCDGPRESTGNATATEYGYRVVAEYPHDTGAFTQGLIWVDTMLIEGTGYYNGPSTLRRVELQSGTVVQIRDTPDPTVFGEGVTQIDERIVQLTWTDHIAYVYDAATFDSVSTFTYPTPGWGLTHDCERFIMSDGTDTLYFRDLDTFEETGRVNVTDGGGRVTGLNELEYIAGEVWANVYLTDRIVVIDPTTGAVTGSLDLTAIIPTPPGVLNGIAWDSDDCRLFVTGKRWNTLFEIELVPNKDTRREM